MYYKQMYNTLINTVKAEINSKEQRAQNFYISGWAFCEKKGIRPLRIKYDDTIISIDIYSRQDISTKFNKPNILFCGWEAEVPHNKYVDIQIKLDNDWKTFLQFDTIITNESKSNIVSNDIVIETTISKREFNFYFTDNYLSNIYIIDNFYENPDDIRTHGLLTFSHKELPNLVKQVPFYKSKIEQIMHTYLGAFDKYESNGEFKLSLAGDSIIFNTMPNKYGGILFLTPNAPVNTGITLYRSKHTKSMTITNDENKIVFKNGHLDSTEFEPVDIIGNIYNRLVIFNTQMIHAVTYNFGNNINNGRLVQIFAFDLKEN